MCFSHLGVFLILVKPMTTEITENKTTPKICKLTVVELSLMGISVVRQNVDREVKVMHQQ